MTFKKFNTLVMDINKHASREQLFGPFEKWGLNTKLLYLVTGHFANFPFGNVSSRFAHETKRSRRALQMYIPRSFVKVQYIVYNLFLKTQHGEAHFPFVNGLCHF